MASDDLTVRVLIEIRDQITQLRVETTERLDGHDRHLSLLGTEMGAMRTEMSAVRTEMVAVHGVLKDVATVMKGRRKLEARVDRCEAEIAELKRKLG